MGFHKNSWIAELNRKYKRLSLEELDEGNKIITKEISEIDKLTAIKGKGWYSYKKICYKLNGYGGYEIGSPINVSFQPYAGNKIFENDCQTIERRLKQRVRYTINKYLEAR